MARSALAPGSKEPPPFIRMAAVRPAVAVSPLAAQHFLNFFPLPHGHGSFRPTVIFHSFGTTARISHEEERVNGARIGNDAKRAPPHFNPFVRQLSRWLRFHRLRAAHS